MKKFFTILSLMILSACANEAVFDYSKKSDIDAQRMVSLQNIQKVERLQDNFFESFKKKIV